MIDEENKSATMSEALAAPAAVPAHAAPAGPAPVEPEDTVFSLPLSHVTQDHPMPIDGQDEDNSTDAPIGAHAVADQPSAPETTPAPAHFAESVAAAIDESAAVFLAPEPTAPVFPVVPAPTAAPEPASTPAPAAASSPAAASAPEAVQPTAEEMPVTATEDASQPHSTPAPAHFAAPEPAAIAPQDEEPADNTTEVPATSKVDDPSSVANAVSPGDTAEIDVAAVEAKLKDPGSTMSFEPLTDERIETDSTYDAGTTTQLMWGARSDVGCVRPHNEDSYLVQSPLFCVCDGMGGHAAGEVASSIAVETIAKTAPQAADAARLAAAVEAANAAVIEAALNGLGKPGMGCTATCAYIENDMLAIAHVGDSRAYLLHEGTLIRVTRDHSYVEELVDAGEITADEARVHPNRSVITRALGSDPAMYADHFTLHIEEGDRLILCSDGLSSMIPDSEIENIATQSSTAQICVDNLVDAALAAGGHDNVTVVVVDLVDDGVMREAKRVRRRNVTIAAILGIAFVLAAAIWAYAGVTGSYYLGTYKDTVAVYRGIPGKPLGLKLHWLESTTAIKLSDLPEDTQNRLKAGIPQTSVDDAQDTISKYRHQIDEEQTRQVIDAQTIRDNTDQESTSKSNSEKTAEQSAEAEASDKN
ncbi:Stp1/IreP family PP2C-type Ser/Thr phosphatase [Collinsella sp. SGI.178]|uniref:Stp1/IreP family PP2C-type Ser/Thr phosphatase n=1 Tax=Collinsella sp. SGI.178 TaxID=3420554 RepID=UPI003CFD0A42